MSVCDEWGCCAIFLITWKFCLYSSSQCLIAFMLYYITMFDSIYALLYWVLVNCNNTITLKALLSPSENGSINVWTVCHCQYGNKEANISYNISYNIHQYAREIFYKIGNNMERKYQGNNFWKKCKISLLI